MTPSLTSQHLRGAAASTLISVIFAFAWGVNGSLALSGSWRVVAAAVIVLVTLALAAVSVTFYRKAAQFPSSSGAPPKNPFRTTAYCVSVVAMLIAIPVASRVLTLSGHGDAIMPAVVMIVGLHFFGPVPAFRSGTFAWVAGAFCLLGLAALFVPVQVGEAGTPQLRYAALGLGCALTLWLGVTPIVSKTFGQLADNPKKEPR